MHSAKHSAVVAACVAAMVVALGVGTSILDEQAVPLPAPQDRVRVQDEPAIMDRSASGGLAKSDQSWDAEHRIVHSSSRKDKEGVRSFVQWILG